MTSRRDTAGRPLLVAFVFAILALLPARWTRWAGWFAEPTAFLVQPLAHPVMRITQWLMPRQAESDQDDPRVLALQEERESAMLALRQAEYRVEQLERQVRDLQSGVALAPGATVRQLWAPVTARSSNLSDGTIRIGAGRAERVEPEVSVAITRGAHLVGRIIEVEARTSWMLPFNHPKAGRIRGVVLTGATFDESFGCQLSPRRDGLLDGDMVAEAVGIEAGQIVRLRDDGWPESAQMLVLGEIIEVDRKENQRLVIVVRPQVAPERVSEVVLRIPEPRTPQTSEAER